MHEISLCESIIQTLQEQAGIQGFHQVKRVRLEVGTLAMVDVAAMRFGFDVVTRGTLAEGSKLDIIVRAGLANCLDCGECIEIRQRYDACPNCGSHHLEITSGEELRIKELEVQ